MSTHHINQLEILEREAFEEAGITLLGQCIDLLRRKDVRFQVLPEGRGLARTLNLLTWQVDHQLEYLDQPYLSADQAIHMGLHQLVDQHLGHQPGAALFAEALASAADLYMVGTLSRAGIETDFMGDTLESFAFYCESYGRDEDYSDICSAMLKNPFDAMTTTVQYLYDFCATCLTAHSSHMAEALEALQASATYPLVHHYHTANWVLALRGRSDALATPLPPEWVRQFLNTEAALLAAF